MKSEKVMKEKPRVVVLLRYPCYQSHVVVSCNHTSAITYQRVQLQVSYRTKE